MRGASNRQHARDARDETLAGKEIVECSPHYDTAEITSLMSTRVICDVLACQVRSGNLANRKKRWDALISG
ncbi:MAG: hypothetical protein A4E19_02835 [Nitrospira sp. SG-bin1]|nr:MAG: hypothetical protein A4E19_02835 [Nitrospira sp. SG-bin1]